MVRDLTDLLPIDPVRLVQLAKEEGEILKGKQNCVAHSVRLIPVIYIIFKRVIKLIIEYRRKHVKEILNISRIQTTIDRIKEISFVSYVHHRFF